MKRPASKAQRLQLLFTQLAAAPPAANHDEAYALIANTLNAIEDACSGVPANPANWRTDGRLYPPQADMGRSHLTLPGVTVYRNVGHRTLIGTNGALAIQDTLNDSIIFEKPGKDGLRLEIE
jgi:hypothetical protein